MMCCPEAVGGVVGPWDRRSHCETADTLDSEITVNTRLKTMK